MDNSVQRLIVSVHLKPVDRKYAAISTINHCIVSGNSGAGSIDRFHSRCRKCLLAITSDIYSFAPRMTGDS